MIAAILAVSILATLSIAAAKYASLVSHRSSSETMLPETILAQDSDSSDEEAIPTDQVDKYIKVYSAMQKNHGLSVEQATSKEGLSVDQFRTLEDKIERNPVVHQRVLDALKASATGKPVVNSETSD
jgi:hypothetical protein